MSKWNKQAPQISQEFIQNEERRKQMIIEAARRRKEKEKKQSQEQEQQLKNTQQALSRHKKEKKDAYLRYLRNNMHDKHQQAKRQQKQQNEVQSRAKWKKRSPSQDSNEHLEALDLEVKMKEQKPKGEKAKITKEFQKEWNDDFQEDWKDGQDELLGSQLLDSLDLDFGTINRQKQVKKLMKDQRLKQEPQKITKQSPQFKDELKRLKDLIGYESVVVGEQIPPKKETLPIKEAKPKQKQAPKKVKPQGNQVETFNELRRKKEGKIMNWAIQEQQQAEDLFSNCSSRRKPNVALRQLNEELKTKKPQMSANLIQPQGDLSIIEEQSKRDKKTELRSNVVRRTKETRPAQEARGTSRSVEKVQAKTTTTAFAKKKPEQVKNVQPQRTVSNSFDRNRSREERKQSIGQRSSQNKVSVESAKKIQPAPKVQNKGEHKEQKRKLGGNIPPLPIRYDNNSIATHDMQIDVQSFIRQDLIGLNEQERQLQLELRDLHINHKGDIKQIFNKYGIRTDYQHSAEIIGEQPRKEGYGRPTETEIQQSLENLDHLLIRRQIQSREQQQPPEEPVGDSFINPFSNSETLCQQVLQLAKNVSRFEKEVEEPVPNGYLQKAGRGKKEESYVVKQTSVAGRREADTVNKYSRKEEEGEVMGQSECESEQVSQVPLGMPPVIGFKEKIHVNRHLLQGLLDDD